mmetsp:Transcript_15372/g.22828  ORF Transcript_15372/g.22828 Transcript_15372/m.22828 type:complete len:125 (+) Transcript_15372:212-586(+)
MLWAMVKASNLNSLKDSEGYFFIDRDGDRFPYVLNFLRSGSLPNFGKLSKYEAILEEADFFGIELLAEICAERMRECYKNTKANEVLKFRLDLPLSTKEVNQLNNIASELVNLSSQTFTLDEDF